MANLGAFSRDFVSGFNTTFRTFQQKAESDARLDLARKADSRAQRNADQADADRAAEEAYFNAQYGGGVAAKAAPAVGTGLPTGMSPPNKLGGVTPTGEPVPVGPDYEIDPARNEEYETGVAKSKGFTPAPPSAVPPPEEVITLEPRAELGGPKEGTRPYKGRLTRGIIADIRAREQQAYEREKGEREFGLRSKEANERMENLRLERERMRKQMTQEDYTNAQMKAQGFSQQASTYAGALRGKENVSVTDPSVAPAVEKLVDALEQGYATTPDGRSIKVNKTPAGYVVDTIDDETGKKISSDVFKTVGDLQAATLMFGQMTQGEKFGEWMAATSAEALGNKVRGTKAEASVNEFRDMIFNASPEQRLDPGWQQQMLVKAKEIEGRFGDLVMDEVKVPVMDPTDPTGKTPALDNNGRPVFNVTKKSKLRDIAELLQPNTQIKTPTGETRDAQSLIDTFLRNPGPLLKEFKSVPAVLSALQMRLEQGGLDPGVAAALVNRAATQLPAALGQALAISAAPVTDSAVPVGPQSSQRALEPGAPDIRTRRAIPPVAVDPNARRIGSPFAR